MLCLGMQRIYLENTSPKKAFSLAIKGGLKLDCAFAWYLKAVGSVMVFRGDDDAGFNRLITAPMVSEDNLGKTNTLNPIVVFEIMGRNLTVVTSEDGILFIFEGTSCSNNDVCLSSGIHNCIRASNGQSRIYIYAVIHTREIFPI